MYLWRRGRGRVEITSCLTSLVAELGDSDGVTAGTGQQIKAGTTGRQVSCRRIEQRSKYVEKGVTDVKRVTVGLVWNWRY